MIALANNNVPHLAPKAIWIRLCTFSITMMMMAITAKSTKHIAMMSIATIVAITTAATIAAVTSA